MFALSTRTRFGPALTLIAATLALFASTPAAATPETLKRSVGNILFAPFDIAASPVTAGKALYTNLREIDDSSWVRIVFPVPGYVWTLGVQIGGGAIREIAGLLELVPGLGGAGMGGLLLALLASALAVRRHWTTV